MIKQEFYNLEINTNGQKLYDFTGSFDLTIEKQQQLGLFFMSRLDAETYLKAVAQSDIDGTETVGLSNSPLFFGDLMWSIKISFRIFSISTINFITFFTL